MRKWTWMSAKVIALLAGSTVMAHSPVTETNPDDGAVLTPSPEVIRIEFADPIRLVGVSLSGADTDADLDVPAAAAARHEFGVPELSAGSYRVEWRGMAGDGHVMSGAFSFEVE